MWAFITRTFLKGLSIVLPIIISLYVIVWLIWAVERILRGVLTLFLPESLYIPGLGFIVSLVIIFLVGLSMYPWVTRKVVGGLDKTLSKIPVFSSIYSPIRDMMKIFGGEMTKELGRPVVVKIPDSRIETFGFVTREDPEGLPENFLPEDHVVVYVQWGYQIGGFNLIVPKDHVKTVDMSVEQGMKWALTAGLSNIKQ